MPKRTATKKSAKKPTKRAASKKPAARKRKANPALMKPMKPSAALAAVVGSTPASRGQITKRLWAYIKKHKLQSPADGRMIKPDAALAKVFGGRGPIMMTAMAKKISRHLS